jgi:hypothetical protein
MITHKMLERARCLLYGVTICNGIQFSAESGEDSAYIAYKWGEAFYWKASRLNL